MEKLINQLTPEELRVECAEAMGWKNHSWELHPNSLREINFDGLWIKDEAHPVWKIEELPNYPADANAALTLAHALAEKGWSHSHVCYGGETDFEFFHFGTARPRFRATATGPHAFALALCRAYLSVIRTGKEQQG